MIGAMTKLCTGCGCNKPLDEFYRSNERKDGRKNPCKVCVRDRVLAYSRDKYATAMGRSKQIHTSAKWRANKRELTFNICVEQVHVMLLLGRCAKTGIAFDLNSPSKGFTNPFGPSLDRIKSNVGYEPDNVQLVCNMFNMGKSDHDQLDFIAMCVAVSEKFRDDPAIIARLKELRDARL